MHAQIPNIAKSVTGSEGGLDGTPAVPGFSSLSLPALTVMGKVVTGPGLRPVVRAMNAWLSAAMGRLSTGLWCGWETMGW